MAARAVRLTLVTWLVKFTDGVQYSDLRGTKATATRQTHASHVGCLSVGAPNLRQSDMPGKLRAV